MSMDISSDAAVNAVMAMKKAQTADQAQMLMLRKSLDNAADSTLGLIASLPEPKLATSGTLGTNLNVFA